MNIKSEGYTVFLGNQNLEFNHFLEYLSPSSIHILTDNNSRKYCLSDLIKEFPQWEDSDIIEIPSGENFKNLETLTKIWSSLIDQKADRKALIINLGGGVITDMGAFAASTFKRGISFIQIPTTLLSMVDASVGGKTGIDFEGEKNMIGTFCFPKAVLIRPSFLSTLNSEMIWAGVSEILKHGLIADYNLYDSISQLIINNDIEKIAQIDLIYRSVEIKNKIVLEDPFEKGNRKLLNFGHTIGHSFETFSLLKDPLPLNHGQSIAMGMVCESYLSHNLGKFSLAELETILPILKKLFPSKKIIEDSYLPLWNIMLNDKKNESGKVNFSFLNSIGDASINHYVNQDKVFEAFNYFNSILDN